MEIDLRSRINEQRFMKYLSRFDSFNDLVEKITRPDIQNPGIKKEWRCFMLYRIDIKIVDHGVQSATQFSQTEWFGKCIIAGLPHSRLKMPKAALRMPACIPYQVYQSRPLTRLFRRGPWVLGIEY
jgi:hypothetical protein